MSEKKTPPRTRAYPGIQPHVANPPRKKDDEPEHWLEKPSTIRTLWIIQIVVLVALVVIDVTMVEHHPHFEADESVGFYAWYGFVTCVAMVVGSKFVVALFLKRRDTYYDGDPWEWVDPKADAAASPANAADAPAAQAAPTVPDLAPTTEEVSK